MSIAQNKAIRPFSELAQQLGRVASQFALGKITKLTVSTWGQTDISITSPDARALLKAQALVGFLSTVDTQGVLPGIVNAPFLAEEVGVAGEALKESPALASIASPYRNLITVEAHVEGGGVTSVTGSVFGNEPCLVSLDNYKNFPALNLNDGSVLKFRNTVCVLLGGVRSVPLSLPPSLLCVCHNSFSNFLTLLPSLPPSLPFFTGRARRHFRRAGRAGGAQGESSK